jgi:preprotein translocase subunit SecG
MLLSFFIGLLTVVLVLTSLFLLLLIIIQLPKKEAGLGQAFGSSTTDALFGAGSGTALTKMTKYAAAIFFSVLLLLTILYTHQHSPRRRGSLEQEMQKAKETASKTLPPAPAPTGAPPIKITLPEDPNLPKPVLTGAPPVVPTTNPAVPPKTNAPATTNVVVPPPRTNPPVVPATNPPVLVPRTNLPVIPLTNPVPVAPKTNPLTVVLPGRTNVVSPAPVSTNTAAPAPATNKPAAPK